MSVIQSRTRLQIRQSILRALGGIAGTATATGDTSHLYDTVYLQGGDDEYNGRHVQFSLLVGAASTAKTWVSDYVGSTHYATLAPVLSGIVTAGDTYEMWPRPFTVNDVNDVIDRAIIDVTRKTLVNKQTTGNFTMSGIYEYSWLTDFKSLHSVEYVYSIGIEQEIDDCDSAWTAGTNATVTADTTFKQEGTACNKIVVSGTAGNNESLAYNTFSAIDLSDCDEVEISIYSTVALTAGYIELRLDDTAGGGSALESLDIPATSANTWTRHKIILANPLSDTAIIRSDIYQVTDVGACTIYVDYVKGVKSTSRVYKELNPQHWEIVKGSTNYLKLTPSGLATVGVNNNLRLNGYELPTIMTADTETCDVDPEFVVEYSLSYLSLYHAKSSQLDIEGRQKFGEIHLGLSREKKAQITMNVPANTVFI